ncbi:LacI family DNA-binding transcriptional regulator [Pelagicoccus sp. SDUM812002]|uniref:LacI family DNA-binding transcriptional regulator n=1 Tax=Pelagicoccus sp. SDUM812002 TaxID=3041266 RepID=UPI00281013EE|nr:LacI family DNA-binding transcriptional regulator [Pelagicoccus sp. SDUM812002]MDQ8186752.1 LacI family DNA-binding transcriptional regulator [Pelagicoccus sp. SDUM812002]
MSPEPKKRVSQAQIAREAGCSQALVSLILNGRTKGIARKSLENVRRIAAQHGYSPRGMKLDELNSSEHIKTVGYILRSPLKLANKSNFFSHIHQGLHEHLSERQIKTVYLGSEDDFQNDTQSVSEHLPKTIKAVAVMGQVNSHLLEELRLTGKPIIYISARATGKCHSVLSNEADSAELLVDHLHQLGHRSFAWIGGTPSGRREERLSALKTALEQRELRLEPEFDIATIEADRNQGFEAAQRIHETVTSKGLPMPTAWIGFNALMARGAINYLFQNGFRIPGDISFAAFDMTRVCTEERPEITSAGSDPEKIGREAGRIILQAIEEETESLCDLTLPTYLCVRDTTAAAKPVTASI